MMISSIHAWPIIVASIVAFGIGALWYSPILFGKEWMALMKMTDADMSAESTKGMWKLYVSQFVITLITFSVLGFFVAFTGSRTAGDGAFLGFLVWLGFSATESVGEILWRKTPLKMVLISSISTLVIYLVGGAIIGAWQ